MKTTMYASLSANGYIAQAGAEREIQPEILADFRSHVRAAGNVVIGRRTFELMLAAGSGGAFAGIDVVVLSTRPGGLPVATVAGSPEQALRHLGEQGHATALIGGGAATYNAFLEQGLVDETYLNITPSLAGDGLRVSGGRPAGLELVDMRRLGDVAQLHHQVSR